MALRGNEERYGTLARTLHWLVVVLFVLLAISGNILVSLEYSDPVRAMRVKIHRTAGLVMFILMAARLCWALFDTRPQPLASLKTWERLLSIAVHRIFYALLMAVPVFGYLFSGASVDEVQFAGFTLPSAAQFSRDASETLIGFHKWLTRLIAFCAVLHIGGVIKHHFMDGIPIWRRMIF